MSDSKVFLGKAIGCAKLLVLRKVVNPWTKTFTVVITTFMTVLDYTMSNTMGQSRFFHKVKLRLRCDHITSVIEWPALLCFAGCIPNHVDKDALKEARPAHAALLIGRPCWVAGGV